jgi:ribonuclease HII
MLICGIDEAGRGPLAGPVVAACVIMPEIIQLDDVKDSKKLKEAERERLFEIIKKNCVEYRIEAIDNKKIDEINILNATMLAMERCLDNLENIGVKVLIDGNYFKLNSGKQKLYNYETIIGGDDKIIQISAASILAKVTRDRLMCEYDKIYPLYNFKRHKGYGTKEHIENIRKFGLCDIHRISFCKKFI